MKHVIDSSVWLIFGLVLAGALGSQTATAIALESIAPTTYTNSAAAVYLAACAVAILGSRETRTLQKWAKSCVKLTLLLYKSSASALVGWGLGVAVICSFQGASYAATIWFAVLALAMFSAIPRMVFRAASSFADEQMGFRIRRRVAPAWGRMPWIAMAVVAASYWWW